MLVVTVAVLTNGLGVGADATDTGPTTQLAEAPIASDEGKAGVQPAILTSGSVTLTVSSAVSPSFETVNL